MGANVLIERIKELETAIEQSAANHNAMVGRMLEAKELLHSMAINNDSVVDAEVVNEDNVVVES